MKLCGFHRNYFFLSQIYALPNRSDCGIEIDWKVVFNIEKKLKPKFYEANSTAKRAHKRSEQFGSAG